VKVNLILSFVTQKMRSELQSANKFLPSTLMDLELKTCEYFTIITKKKSITQYMYTIHSDWYRCLCFCALHVEETMATFPTWWPHIVSYVNARVSNQAVRGEPKPTAPVRTLGNL